MNMLRGISLACYNIVFSYEGQRNGDYENILPEISLCGFGFRFLATPKLLVPATRKVNLDLALNYTNANLNGGIEVLGSVNDRNTFSSLDDEDNKQSYFMPIWRFHFSLYALNIDYEQRSDKTSLFGNTAA